MKKPITPHEAARGKLALIPDEVVEVVNGLIERAFSSGSATLRQCDVVDAIVRRYVKDADPPSAEVAEFERALRARIFQEHWLDFEPIYRAAGWIVEYDRPGYCETYEPTWEFRAKRGRFA